MKCDAIIRQLDLEDDRHRAGEWTAILDHQQEQIKEWYKALQKQNEEIVSELKTSRIEQKTREQIKEERECHQMFRNSEYEAYKNRNPDRVADTCLWFLGHANYKGWLENQTSGLLWITADPGCGKSVLSKSLVDNELRSNDVRTTCYFFFKDNPEQSSVTKAVCALLHQLFLQKSSLIRHAIPIYSHNGSQLPELFDLLWEILKQATADPEAGEVVCVVDALDECEESGRRRFIRALNSLYWDYTGEATSLRVKFLVTSRPYIDIEFDFQNLTERTPTIRLEGEEETEKISQEINLVIKDSVRKISHRLLLEESVSSSLEKTLLNTSQRTYLWLYLVLETFEEQGLTQAEVQDLIRTLPKSVYDAYQSILNKIKPHKKQLAKRLLQIVLVAAKPLTLQEMNVALGLKEGDKSQVSLPNQDAFKKRVRSLCGLFVSVVDKKLYLIHQTAKEYLIAENESQTEHGLWQHSLTPREAHLVLAKICINYLLFSTFEHHPLLLDDDQDSHTYNSRISQYLAEHDFLQYAALHWSAHFREADIHDPAVLNMVLNIVDTQSKRFRTWFRVYLDLNGEVFNIFSPGTHELIVESYFGHTTIVSMLLTRSDVSPDYKDPNGRTALWWAADRGHTEVVKLLLARPEVDINSKDRGGDTPLTRAALEGHEAMTKLLLAHPRIDADVKGTWNRTPLYCAARQGHPGVVAQLLARPEVDPDVKDNDGLTPLANAAASGNEAITALLLMRPEVNADETDAIGRTPLYWAAVHGKEKVVALLLARPEVHPGVANWKGKTPLSAAMENGQMATAAMISSALKAHRNS